jgi:hypothetical protein
MQARSMFSALGPKYTSRSLAVHTHRVAIDDEVANLSRVEFRY